MDDHGAEVERLRAQQRMAVESIRNSFQYRLGDTLVRALTSRAGAKAAPGNLFRLLREAKAHRSTRSEIPTWSGAVRRPMRVASILDEFSHLCFAPEFALTPVRGVDELAPLDPALVLCESAWQGNGGFWSGAFSQPGSDSSRGAEALIAQARRLGIPTVFWNKDDPPNFEVFISAAEWFDYVFTTDAALVPEYQRRLGHERIAPLLFAAQPAIHNPIGSTLESADRVAFSGSWRAARYPARAAQTRLLLDAAMEVGRLDLYDRFAHHPNRDLRFPAEYQSASKGTLAYSDMAAAYRRYAAFLNVNSVTGSPTMVSRRVFEVLGSRTPVISTPSDAIESIFAETVLVARNRAEARGHIERLVGDTDFRVAQAHRGYRLVHSRHTYARRVDEVLETVGIAGSRISADPGVCVILVSNRPERLDNALENYRRQKYPSKRLLFVTNSADFDRTTTENRVKEVGGRVLHVDEQATLADCLNEALEHCDDEFFAKFDDDDHYGPDYLGDQLLAFGYTDASIVGKNTYFVRFERDGSLALRFPGHEFEYVDRVQGGTLVVRRRDVAGIRFQPVVQGTDTRYLNDIRGAGLKIFSTDRFNYVLERRVDKSTHTWVISDAEILASADRIEQGRLRDTEI